VSLSPEEHRLEKALKKEYPGLLTGIPEEKRRQLLNVLQTRIPVDPGGTPTVIQTQMMTSSPVPPAELLTGYNAAFPDGANRLFSLVENQSAHRQKLEDRMTAGQLAQSRTGQNYAFILAILFGIFGFTLALLGHTSVAITIFATTVLGLAGVFVAGQVNQKRNLDKKAPK
jgi:uncharacterized membrane protein